MLGKNLFNISIKKTFLIARKEIANATTRLIFFLLTPNKLIFSRTPNIKVKTKIKGIAMSKTPTDSNEVMISYNDINYTYSLFEFEPGNASKTYKITKTIIAKKTIPEKAGPVNQFSWT